MKTAEKLYTSIKQGAITFDGAHNVHTPERLVDEILTQLSITGNVLVMFNIEFVISLVYTYGIDPSRVFFYSDHKDKEAIAKRLKTRVINSLEHDMKFDVVIGNPPYQDAKKNPLYYKFHNTAINNLLVEDGILAFITPNAMAVSLETGIIKGCHKVERREILTLNVSTSIKKKHFKDVGINNFCYYIVKNTPKLPGVGYPIVTDDGVSIDVLSEFKPIINNSLVKSILNKAFTFNVNFYRGVWNTAGSAGTVDPDGKDQVAVGIKADGTFNTYNVTWKTKHKYYNRPKVFIAAFGNRASVAYDHTLVCAKEKMLFTVPTNSNDESENLITVLNCKLKTFFAIVTAGRAPYTDFARHFNGVDLHKPWTDTEIFDHFNFDQKEIEYIDDVISRASNSTHP